MHFLIQREDPFYWSIRMMNVWTSIKAQQSFSSLSMVELNQSDVTLHYVSIVCRPASRHASTSDYYNYGEAMG